MRYDMGELLLDGPRRIVYDGHDLGEAFEIIDVETDMHPQVELITSDVPGVAGSHYFSRRVLPRNVTIRLAHKGRSRDKFQIFEEWRDYSSMLAKKEPRRLYLDEARYLNAILEGETPIDFVGDRGLVDVHFTAPDPYFHGETPRVHPIKAGRNRFLVTSLVETWPTITVTGAAGELTVSEEASGLIVTVPNAGGTTVIDTKRMKAFVDGAFAPVDMEVTDFWPLPGGAECRLTLSQGEGTVEYEELS